MLLLMLRLMLESTLNLTTHTPQSMHAYCRGLRMMQTIERSFEPVSVRTCSPCTLPRRLASLPAQVLAVRRSISRANTANTLAAKDKLSAACAECSSAKPKIHGASGANAVAGRLSQPWRAP